jgi:hypothetical protein
MNQPWGRGEQKIDSIKMLQESTPIIGTGEWDDIQCLHFKGENGGLKVGDVILVREGAKPLALCEINGNYFKNSDLTEKYLYENYRNIRILDWANNEMTNFPQPQKTLQILYQNNNSNSWNYINTWYKKIKNMQRLQEHVNLLKSCKNLIFTGAPGTGKTYLAKQIAKQMIGVTTDEELEQSEQCAFVQFHPSYDYTDFVEGLRPTKPDNNGNIGFELKEGIFKKFCFGALQNIEDSKKDKEELTEEKLLEQKYDTLIDQIQNGEVDKLPLKTSSKYAEISGISDNGNILFKKPNTGLPSSNTVSLARLKKLAKEYKTKEELGKINNINKGIRDIIGGCNTTWFWSVLHYMYDKYGNQTDTQPIEIVKPKNYIFVIDEINRGEISKIFGELFFSIDPSYRGKKGSVKTQYSNMYEDPNEDFYIPENVYIIGTMNDIDRSVESFDFAMRRRFSWEEITSEDSAENMNLPKEIKDRMTKLNTKISGIDGLNVSYHVGGAYFLDTDGKPRTDYETIWQFRLEPLLKEYLRGMSEVEEKLKDLKNAYDAETDNG